MRARLAILLGGGLLLARCSCYGGDPVAIATVEVDALSATRCVRVVAQEEDGGLRQTGELAAAPGDRLAVAVFQGDLGGDTFLRAEGFSAPDCAPSMDEASSWQRVRFQARSPVETTLLLRPEGSCSDGLDGDGDGLVDCADRACQPAPECGGPPDGGGPDGGGPDGGNPDGGGDAGPPGGYPYAPSNFLPDAIPPPDAGLTINCDAGYDTATGRGWLCGAPVPAAVPITMQGGAPAVLLPLGPLTITDAGRLTVRGDRPLILAVRGDALIDGPLFAGAEHARPGPGGSRPACVGNGDPGVAGAGGGAGGGGGGYGQAGASGGSAGTNGAGTPGNGGSSFGSASLVPLLGGCSGGPGGETTSGCLRDGGAGGGAIQLSASGVLWVSSAIAAPGGGGLGGDPAYRCGGGGGGSGGAILLEALRLELGASARVTANGGAGSEGSDNAPSSFQFGQDGRVDGPLPARGGDSANDVAAGGDGGSLLRAPTVGETYQLTNGGGGGGGGGAGRIRLTSVQGCVHPPNLALLYSPPPTSNLQGDAGCP